jgi:quinoprotein glucose dehydrogenase
MYVVTAHSTLVALDPDTGKQVWVFSHKHNARPPRGVAYWPGDRDNAARLLFGTGDGFLLAVDAKTGQAISGFGTEGEVDLKKGMKTNSPM